MLKKAVLLTLGAILLSGCGPGFFAISNSLMSTLRNGSVILGSLSLISNYLATHYPPG